MRNIALTFKMNVRTKWRTGGRTDGHMTDWPVLAWSLPCEGEAVTGVRNGTVKRRRGISHAAVGLYRSIDSSVHLNTYVVYQCSRLTTETTALIYSGRWFISVNYSRGGKYLVFLSDDSWVTACTCTLCHLQAAVSCVPRAF